jgi:hypothetical protein
LFVIPRRRLEMIILVLLSDALLLHVDARARTLVISRNISDRRSGNDVVDVPARGRDGASQAER